MMNNTFYLSSIIKDKVYSSYKEISDSDDFVLNHEVDEACWFSVEDSKKMIKENSLAQQFLFKYLRVDYDMMTTQ